ncbi:hypothetical protein DFR50_101181 [Roseiarcus fermentans]|uniref:Uncharacterized protein n=1 Tax=Roseiarcus fermentans TaxID=1473586 RepID=A0A366FUG9_9HYPH|nr:hypothetical protein [Roseiarcus fermentans]RBP18237.1 hypothetical protein DFR50_101181 [Roseiarcus fermentans]
MPSRLWLILAFIVAFGATPAQAARAPARLAQASFVAPPNGAPPPVGATRGTRP